MIDFTDKSEIVIGTPSKDYEKCKCINIITKDLDKMSGLPGIYDSMFHHYILCTSSDYDEHMAAIRVPGGTVGTITWDNDFIITNCVVDTDYVIRTYWRNVNKHLKKYIGQTVVFEDSDKEVAY